MLKCVKNFEVYLPAVRLSAKRDQQCQESETLNAEVFTTAQILSWPAEAQEKLRTEVENLFSQAFPEMPREGLEEFISHYFWRPCKNFHTQTILLRNKIGKLVGTTLFYCGEVNYNDDNLVGIYIHVRAALREYQKFGLGRVMSKKILMELQPDVLFTTCAQSSSLHSWIGLCQKGLITDFEVYPRLEQGNGQDVLITIPYKDLDFTISMFKQLFLVGVAEGKQEKVEQAIRNLTVLMTRKNIGMIYGFDPWRENGREDKLANALGVETNDGVVVIFRKKSNYPKKQL